jgi:outer membrane protein assembly factor BamB
MKVFDRRVDTRRLGRAKSIAWLWPLVAASFAASCDLIEPNARSSESGRDRLLWRNDGVVSAHRVIFDDQRVYVLGLQHAVWALDKTTGKTLWQTKLTPSAPGRNGIGLMIVQGHLVVGDIDLFALDPATGALIWRYVPSIGAWPGYSKQWTDGNTIYCGSASGHVYAVDAASGTERWVTHIVGDTTTNVYSPIVDHDTVFVGYTWFARVPSSRVSGGVAALDASTGHLLWSRLLPQRDTIDKTAVWSDPSAILVTPTMVVTQAADDSMYGLNRATGSIVRTIPATEFTKAGAEIRNAEDLPSLAMAGGTVVMASTTMTTISALTGTDLHHLWTVPFAWLSPTRISADDRQIYAGAAGGQFAVYDLTGRLVWTIARGDLRADHLEGFFFPPAIDDDLIYLPGSLEMYAFRK